MITNPFPHQEEDEEVDVMPSNHVTISDDDKEDSTIEEDVEEAPTNFEEENEAAVDELKEINLGTIENSQPIFLSMNLSQEEEDAYK